MINKILMKFVFSFLYSFLVEHLCVDDDFYNKI